MGNKNLNDYMSKIKFLNFYKKVISCFRTRKYYIFKKLGIYSLKKKPSVYYVQEYCVQ